MKILKISLCNLASLEGEHIVDFEAEPLRSANLFAITGDTGAGKSTLLDAMCLALFNKAPRFDSVQGLTRFDGEQLGDDELQPYDTRNILRRGCNEGYAAVEFSTTIGARYEARWSARIKRTGSYERVVRSLKQIHPTYTEYDGTLRGFNDRLKDITGLEYDQFVRTVLLAQNSFANFLRAKHDEKSALLEKITGTAVYARISAKVFELSKEAKQQCDEKAAEITGMSQNILDETDLKRTTDELQLALTRQRHTQETLTKVGKQLHWFELYRKATEDVAMAETAHNEARRLMMMEQTNRQRLERRDLVLPMQPLFNKVTGLTDNIKAAHTQETALTSQREQQQDILRKQEEALRLVQSNLADVLQRRALRQPVINEGLSLQGEIKTAQAQMEGLRKALTQEQKLSADKQKAYDLIEAELVTETKQLEKTVYTLQALSVHGKMFEHYQLIKAKLQRLSALQAQERELRKAMEDYKANIMRQRQSSQDMEQKSQANEDTLSALNDQIRRAQLHIEQKDGATLQERLTTHKGIVQSLHAAKDLWRRISNAYAELNERQLSIRSSEAKYKSYIAQLNKLIKEENQLRSVYESDAKNYDLSSSQNVVQLREQLREGTPCPVCGGTHHPFHTETAVQLNELHDNLLKKKEESRLALDAKMREVKELNDMTVREDGIIEEGNRSLAALRKQLAEDVEAWQKYAAIDNVIRDASPSVDATARFIMIDQLIESHQKRVQEYEADLQLYNMTTAQIRNIEQQKAAIMQANEAFRKQLDEARSRINVLLTMEEGAKKALADNDTERNLTFKEIDGLITIKGWYESLDAFGTRLDVMMTEWKDLTAKQASAESRMQKLTGERNTAYVDWDNVRQSATDMAEQLAYTQHLCEKKEADLRLQFGLKTPEAENQELQALEDKARQELKVQEELYAAERGRLETIVGQLQNAQQQRELFNEMLGKSRAELDIKIAQFNGTYSPVQMTELERIFEDTTDWNALRAHIQSIDDAFKAAEAKFKAAFDYLNELQRDTERPSDRGDETEEELMKHRVVQEEKLQEVNRAIDAAQLLLSMHREAEKRTAGVLAELELLNQRRADWESLSALIGSADGRKFSQQVQAFTFGFLVQNANKQLARLSPRYSLQNVPNSLALEIIDRDMYDGVRPASSLSGGETFVVSLALALGLTDLTSGEMTIGSLFIDEGFGNLDNDSLSLVMQAMDRLQSQQGRKVGIISHTDQIRQNIRPQIQIIKAPSGGRSTIQIN